MLNKQQEEKLKEWFNNRDDEGRLDSTFEELVEITQSISQESYERGVKNVVDKITEIKEKLLKKARQTDYADGTEYDECCELLESAIINLLTSKGK